MVIVEGELRMSPTKLEAVSSWPTPQNKKEVQKFLGFTNFYRRFVKDFSKIAKPLHELTGSNPWEWTPRQEEAFDSLRKAMTSAPVIAIPKDEGKFKIECDASDYAIGGVLLQQQTDGKWKTLDFMSKGMKGAEWNYQTYDKELLAIITALEKWRKHLIAAREPFEIWSDHLNLTYYRQPQKLSRRQARWVSDLQDYNFTLHHLPGRSNGKADLLSRRPGHETGENDNDEVVALDPSVFRRHLDATEEADQNIMRRIKEAMGKVEPSVRKEVEEGVQYWLETEDGYLLWKNKVYVPKDDMLREDLLRIHHDSPVSGHPGTRRMHELMTRSYWWPYIDKDIARYVQGCETCQRTKPERKRKAAPLNPTEIPEHPWETISWDLIRPLPVSRGYDAILVIVDRFTKRIIVQETNTDLTAEGSATLMRDRMFRNHGLPCRVISDRGPQFVSAFMKELYRLLGIEGRPSTAYHPQTDGQTERMNQEIEQYLRIFVNHKQDNWVDWLPLAEFSYNDKKNASTGYTPFFLDMGQNPWKGAEPKRDTRNPEVESFMKDLNAVRDQAKKALEQAADTMKQYHDKKK
jgi:transposase InsO family protein